MKRKSRVQFVSSQRQQTSHESNSLCNSAKSAIGDKFHHHKAKVFVKRGSEFNFRRLFGRKSGLEGLSNVLFLSLKMEPLSSQAVTRSADNDEKQITIKRHKPLSAIVDPSVPVVTSIEKLPVEVLIEIFEFFSADTLVNAFYNFNAVLNTIIEQHTPLHFNFAWNSQCSPYFNRFLLKCNPTHVTSLRLHVETNSNIMQFCQNLPFFVGLRFLIFKEITSRSYESVRDLLAASLPHLKQLCFLKIETRFLSGTQCLQLEQAALSAPSSVQKFEHIIMPFISPYPQTPALRYKEPQLNLKSFYFQRTSLDFKSLVGLFSAIPNIISLTVTLSAWDHDSINYDDLPELRALKTLNASFTWWEHFSIVRMEELRVLLTKMPNLTRLRVGTCSQNLTEVSDGQEWAKLLLTHAKRLSKVQLKLRHHDSCSVKQVESVRATFKEHDYWRERRVAFQYGMCEEESEDEELIVTGSV